MENAYGIGVTNRYHLFLDDDADPLELLQLQERERELKKRSKIAEKENKVKVEPKPKATPVPRKAKETENTKTQENKIREEKVKPDDTRSERPPRAGRFSGENREDRNNRRNREDTAFNNAVDKEWKPRRDFADNEGGERRPFGGGRGRGGRGNFEGRGNRGSYENRPGRSSYDHRGKREHESQQSDGSWDKRQANKDNGDKWSKTETVQPTEAKPVETDAEASWDIEPSTDVAPVASEVTDKTSEHGEESTETTAAVVEEEPKELTLDEWKAQRAERQKPNYNLRKAGEGEDPSQWKKMYALDKKREGTESELEEDLEFDISDYPQRVGRQKHILDIQFTFNDARRGGPAGRGWGRGRGGRGQGRGFGNRGERPGSRPPFKNDDSALTNAEEGHAPEVHVGRGRQNAPKVDDEHDFPSLG